MENSTEESHVYETYTNKYFIYALVNLMTVIVTFGITEYTSMAIIVTQYYDVGFVAIDFTALVSVITTLLFFNPISNVVSKQGIRCSLVSAMAINAFATSLKTVAVKQYSFWLIMIAQSIQAIIYIFPMAVIPVIIANWFTTNEGPLIVLSCVAFNFIGTLISFAMPLIAFKEVSTNEEIGKVLGNINMTTAVFSFTLLILTILVVNDKPRSPPATTEGIVYEAVISHQSSLLSSLKCSNAILLLVCHSLHCTVLQVIVFTLNQTVSDVFDNQRIITSIAGILMSSAGILATVFSVITHDYPKFKYLLLMSNITMNVIVSLFILGLWLINASLLYGSLFMLSLINIGVLNYSVEYCFEVCHPFPKSILSVLLVITAALPNVVITPLTTLLISEYGAVIANLLPLSSIFVSTLLMLFIRSDKPSINSNDTENNEQLVSE